jgi:hypothetical protein
MLNFPLISVSSYQILVHGSATVPCGNTKGALIISGRSKLLVRGPLVLSEDSGGQAWLGAWSVLLIKDAGSSLMDWLQSLSLAGQHTILY